MTFKFEFTYHNINYIIRIYPQNREEIASLEKEIYGILTEHNIKIPLYITSSIELRHSKINFIIYRKLEGFTLREIFTRLSDEQKTNLVCQIKENYERISEIKTKGSGIITNSVNCSHSLWINFLKDVINKSYPYIIKTDSLKGINSTRLLEKLLAEVKVYIPERNNLIWSDFSEDNIIISEKGQLIGFIDFECMMGGDSLLGIGYLYAQDGDAEFSQLYNSLFVNESQYRLIKFYSVIRYLRLLSYLHLPLPNGQVRDPLNKFLPKAYEIIKQYSTS
jgi:hypothetical protein